MNQEKSQLPICLSFPIFSRGLEKSKSGRVFRLSKKSLQAYKKRRAQAAPKKRLIAFSAFKVQSLINIGGVTLFLFLKSGFGGVPQGRPLLITDRQKPKANIALCRGTA